MFRGRVEADHGHTRLPDHRAVLEQQPALRRVLLAEEPDRALRDVHRAPEVHLEQRARHIIRHGLVLPDRDVAGVVENNVDAAEGGLGLRECGVDLLGLRHVELHDAKTVCGVLLDEVVERGGIAQCCDDFVAALERLDDRFAAEAGGGTGDCRRGQDERTAEQFNLEIDSLSHTRGAEVCIAGRSIIGVEVVVGVVGAEAPEDADFAEWCGLPSLAATFLIPLIVARIVVYRPERCVKT